MSIIEKDLNINKQGDFKTNYSRIKGIQSNINSLIDLANVTAAVRLGKATSTQATEQDFTFETPFDIGLNEEVLVFLQSVKPNHRDELALHSATKTGFSIDRANNINGNVPFNYVALSSFNPLIIGVYSAEITPIDGTNYKLEVKLINAPNAERLDIIFSDYSGTEPIPTEVTIDNYVDNQTVREFVFNELTFDDPNAASGEVYTVILDLKDSIGQSIKSFEFDIIVQ